MPSSAASFWFLKSQQVSEQNNHFETHATDQGRLDKKTQALIYLNEHTFSRSITEEWN